MTSFLSVLFLEMLLSIFSAFSIDFQCLIISLNELIGLGVIPFYVVLYAEIGVPGTLISCSFANFSILLTFFLSLLMTLLSNSRQFFKSINKLSMNWSFGEYLSWCFFIDSSTSTFLVMTLSSIFNSFDRMSSSL